MKSWSPYVVGGLIGVLSWFSFATADRPLGISTAVARTAGMAASLPAPDHVARNGYFAKFPPVVDWEWMLVIGVALGAFVSSRLSGGRPPVSPEPTWRERFGGSPALRMIAATAGGVLLMFGARLAGGCTSGHGISGIAPTRRIGLDLLRGCIRFRVAYGEADVREGERPWLTRSES